MEGRVLDFIALGMLIFVVLTFVYGIIFIHDIPYEIAKKRNHPHQDAIHTAGWVSLFLMHTIWPFLWIWATLYKPDMGWGFGKIPGPKSGMVGSRPVDTAAVDEIMTCMTELEQKRKEQQKSHDLQIQELLSRMKQIEKQLVREGGE